MGLAPSLFALAEPLYVIMCHNSGNKHTNAAKIKKKTMQNAFFKKCDAIAPGVAACVLAPN